MPTTKEAIIKGVYSRFKGTIAQTYKGIKDDPNTVQMTCHGVH